MYFFHRTNWSISRSVGWLVNFLAEFVVMWRARVFIYVVVFGFIFISQRILVAIVFWCFIVVILFLLLIFLILISAYVV